MLDRARPAAYIRAYQGEADLDRQREAIAEGARQRGWPPATVYLEDQAGLAGGRAPVLARLEAAIEAGRHDALFITDPGAVTGTASHLMGLLQRCTRNGVVAGFLLPPPVGGKRVMSLRRPALSPAPEDALPFRVRREAWGLLARTHMQTLSELFPDWRIWLDQHGWHARRRDAVYLQICHDDVPAFAVHADTAASLALALCWQQAADQHAPDECPAR
jgi:hypothetical protein